MRNKCRSAQQEPTPTPVAAHLCADDFRPSGPVALQTHHRLALARPEGAELPGAAGESSVILLHPRLYI